MPDIVSTSSDNRIELDGKQNFCKWRAALNPRFIIWSGCHRVPAVKAR